MSCNECERLQESEVIHLNCFIRIGNGNVCIIACEKHFEELQKMVRAYYHSED